MKTIIFSFIFLTIYGCNQSNSNGKEKQTNDTLNLDVALNDSLKTQILYHGDCSYSLSETEGWIANPGPTQMSEHIRILVMYEPNSSVIHSAPIGIYSNVIFKKDYKDSTFNGFLKGEMESALDRGEKVIEAKSIKTHDNKKAIIRKYLIESIGEYFAIAYIDEPKYIIMITFTTKDLIDLNNHYKSFENIIKSYKYLGITIKDET
ncbi:MAG: hypothetical protein ACK5BV_02425 [Bacteroidota bacterium]|jgi:hypothetical protein